MKLLAGGGAVPVPKSSRESAREPRVDAPTAMADTSEAPHEEEPHHGVRIASLREVLAELDAQRQIDLKYEIERYVRPAEIDFGHFRYSAAPGAPNDLSYRIKVWLEKTSGVEWEVLQSNDGAPESTAETRVRRGRERLKAAESHPRIAEALKVFPGSRVLRIDEPEAQEELEDAPAVANVIHVDFAPRERAIEEFPEPEEREDDN